MSSSQSRKNDWSATQYLKFGNERTRAVYDLASQIPLSNPTRIVDIGCGPGNSTQVLKSRYPDAKITGMDSSPDMIKKAQATLPDVQFELGDLRTWEPSSQDSGADVLFSNAVFHWMRTSERIPIIIRLLKTLKSGGVLAFQVPDNYFEPSHKAMRETAFQVNKPWTATLGALKGDKRPDLDPIEPASEFYNALIEHCSGINMWTTRYQHILGAPRDIVEWVRGTGLQPFVNPLEEGLKEEFLKAYEERVAKVYPRLMDGRVMLGYPRLFVVAVRK